MKRKVKIMEILKKLKIKEINLVLIDMEKENYYESEIVIPLNLEELIKILEDEVIQNILKKKLDVLEIYLEYPKFQITDEIIEKINKNKVGKKVQGKVKLEYWENGERKEEEIEVVYLKDLVQSYINEEDFMIVLHSFNKENLIQCIENLLNILEEGSKKEVNS